MKRTHNNTTSCVGCPTPHAPRPTANGFTLLFAIFASALILSIGLSIYSIARKELLLSSAGRESQSAFTAADTGSECALYWDFQHHAFTPQLPGEEYSTTLTCGNTSVNVSTGNSYPNVESFTIDLPEGNCVDIEVRKDDNISDPSCPSRCTTVVASGYNTCNTADLLRLQRAIRVIY